MSLSQRRSYREDFRKPSRVAAKKSKPAFDIPVDPFAGMNAEQRSKEKVRLQAIDALRYFDAGSPRQLPDSNPFKGRAVEHLRGDHFKKPQASVCPVCLRKSQRDTARVERLRAAGFNSDGTRREEQS